MKDITIGTVGTAETSATREQLAVSMESGGLEVFATPAMIALMEKAACHCVADFLTDDETTVGTELNVKHVSATPEGMAVRAEAELIGVNGRQLTFSVKAFDERGLIGEGTHGRFVVYGKRFTEKAAAKLNK